MKKFMFIVSFCLALPNLTYGFGLFSKDKNEPDYSVPKNTEVIMHFSSMSSNDPYTLFPASPVSQVFYYDVNGKIIGSCENDIEMHGDIILEGKDEIAYLFKNSNILSTHDSFKIYDANLEHPDLYMSGNREGLDQSGYLKDKQIFYSLLNIGFESSYDHYIHIVRFTSDTQTYDVVVPYYLDSICYDSVTEKFICLVSDVNVFSDDRLTEEKLINDYFKYMELYFDKTTNKFTLNEELQTCPYHHQDYYNGDDFLSGDIMAHNNKLYYLTTVDTKEYKETKPLIATHANLVLITMNLEDKTANHKLLKTDYETTLNSYPVLSGSNHLPSIVVNNKLYMFTSDYEVWIVEDENNIKTLKIPDFFGEDTLSLKPIGRKNNSTQYSSFFLYDISVEDDGNIYIMTLDSDEVFRINKLSEDGKYELFWEGEMPDLNKHASYLKGFEIINYSNLK